MAAGQIRKILVANRSEIAIRVFRAATELGIQTVAVFAEEDKLALHRFKADEAYQIGKGLGPLEAYLVDRRDHPGRAARRRSTPSIPATASSPRIPTSPRPAPRPASSSSARRPRPCARSATRWRRATSPCSVGVPVMPASEALPDDLKEVRRMAAEIGYPVMLKASWGGGGRGMRAIATARPARPRASIAARREAKAAFGKRRGLSRKAGRSAPATSRSRSSATARQRSSTSSSATARPAPAPEGRRARAGALSRRRSAAPSSARLRSRSPAPRTMSAPARSSS